MSVAKKFFFPIFTSYTISRCCFKKFYKFRQGYPDIKTTKMRAGKNRKEFSEFYIPHFCLIRMLSRAFSMGCGSICRMRAPMQKTIAAAIIRFNEWDSSVPLYLILCAVREPFCVKRSCGIATFLRVFSGIDSVLNFCPTLTAQSGTR